MHFRLFEPEEMWSKMYVFLSVKNLTVKVSFLIPRKLALFITNIEFSFQVNNPEPTDWFVDC